MEKGLVSIITPCYNSEQYVHRLLDSILMQDYPSIEMFTIDDGSTDKTKKIIESYIPRFYERGYKLTYIYQENAGQAAAVNRGLKLISGEFLLWPDSDDFYNKTDSITTFVNNLKELDDSYGVICFIGTFVDEFLRKDLKWDFKYNENEWMFESCLLGGDFLAVPINYMVRMSAFDRVNPKHEIYTGRAPQNIQMLLPMFYSYKCRTIRQSLCCIVVRKLSHSHNVKSYEGQLNDIQGYIEIYHNTLMRIIRLSEEEKEKYCQMISQRFQNERITLALNFGRYKDARFFAQELCSQGNKLSMSKRIKITLSYCPLLYLFVMRVKEKFVNRILSFQ